MSNKKNHENWAPVINRTSGEVTALLRMPIPVHGDGYSLGSIGRLWPNHALGNSAPISKHFSEHRPKSGHVLNDSIQHRLERWCSGRNVTMDEFVEQAILYALDLVEAVHGLELAVEHAKNLFEPVAGRTRKLLEQLEPHEAPQRRNEG